MARLLLSVWAQKSIMGGMQHQDGRLANISIVLVDTKTPANIGAAARCMMNMGLSRLVLVNPPKDKNGDARRLAAGADAILDSAVVHQSLQHAISDQNLAIGATRQAGNRRRDLRTPREMSKQVVPLLDRNKICLVFGNEVTGLEKKEIALCQELVSIPSSHAFPSLNLSHAVMVVSYELFTEITGCDERHATREIATLQRLELFYAHLQRTLELIGFFNTSDAERMMFSLRQLFGKAKLDSREISILRGILTAIDSNTTGTKAQDK